MSDSDSDVSPPVGKALSSFDTDKYTGHTEGPWEWDGLTLQTIEELDDGYIGVIDDQQSYHLGQRNHPDKQLIADAPDLLAEVKRLRREIAVRFGYQAWVYGDD